MSVFVRDDDGKSLLRHFELTLTIYSPIIHSIMSPSSSNRLKIPFSNDESFLGPEFFG